jgi:hypothetical protein
MVVILDVVMLMLISCCLGKRDASAPNHRRGARKASVTSDDRIPFGKAALTCPVQARVAERQVRGV